MHCRITEDISSMTHQW